GGGARRDARTRGGPALDPRAPPPPRLRPRALGGRGASDAAAGARARTMAVAVGSDGTPMVAVAERPWRPGTRPLLAAASGGILALMASTLACYTAAFVAGVRWLGARKLPVIWLGPLLWVALEWLRGWFFIGFPWAALGYSQYRHHDLVQIAEVTGVYGVSAIL